MEAGNRCFDENLPEETNRKIVDHISDINLPYTEHARRYLLSEGIKKENIYVTGSPMREVAAVHRQKILNSRILNELELDKKQYILLSSHREENIDNEANFDSLMNAVNEMAAAYGMPVIYSVHPRSARLIKERGFSFHPLVKELPPFSYTDYSFLQKHAFCVVSDSGTLAEESAIWKFPAVSIRTSTERPEALEKGSFIIGGITGGQLLQAVEMAAGFSETGIFGDSVPDYEGSEVSSTVVKIIQGCTGIVNDRVWRKNLR
jgi:UDP-N-acetylglucosamine 2-epimerase (non-hydrolysing)